MYGLRVRSDVRLPSAPEPGGDGAPPDVVFRRARAEQPIPPPDGPAIVELRCFAPCHAGSVVNRVYRGSGGAWFWYDAIGTCHVAPDARHVEVYAENGDRDLGLVMAGQIAVFVLHRLGYPTLHASAAVTEHGAIAFVGSHGQGKSTLAACLLRHGAALLTDDVLSLRLRNDGVYGAPGLPMMKITRGTAECTLGLTDELPNVAGTTEKKLFVLGQQYRHADAPERLRALYVLDRYDPVRAGRREVAIRPFDGRGSLASLLPHVSHGEVLRPTEMARLLPLYARLAARVPVRLLSYPTGFEYQRVAHERVMADVAQLGELRP